MGNDMIKNKIYKENLDVDTEKITNYKTKESFILTRSSGEFAHFVKLLSLMKQLTIDSYHLNPNEDEYEDEDEDEDEDENEDEDEDDDEDINGGSDDVEKNDANNIELKDISSLTTTSHIYANADIRNRGNNNNPKINQTLSESLPTEKKEEEWYKISQPGIYEIYKIFINLRGMSGIVMYYIKQFVQNNNNELTTDETQKKKIYQELYEWCQKNFSKTLQYTILVDSFVNEMEKFLQKKNDVNSQHHIIEIKHVNPVNNNNNNNHNQDEDQKIDDQIDYFLNLIEQIKEKRKGFITYEYDNVNEKK